MEATPPKEERNKGDSSAGQVDARMVFSPLKKKQKTSDYNYYQYYPTLPNTAVLDLVLSPIDSIFSLILTTL